MLSSSKLKQFSYFLRVSPSFTFNLLLLVCVWNHFVSPEGCYSTALCFFSFFASGYYLNAISFVAASNSGLLILFFLTLLMFVLLK